MRRYEHRSVSGFYMGDILVELDRIGAEGFRIVASHTVTAPTGTWFCYMLERDLGEPADTHPPKR